MEDDMLEIIKTKWNNCEEIIGNHVQWLINEVERLRGVEKRLNAYLGASDYE